MSKITNLKNEIANAEQLTDADTAALAGAARDLLAGDFVGMPLKFRKGLWFKAVAKGETVEIGETETFIVDPLSYCSGWVRWEGKSVTAKIGPGRPIDGFILPVRDRLSDQDKDRWPLGRSGKREDPWKENHQITMKDTADDALLTWVTSTWGGRKAIGQLISAFIRERKQHPGLFPVVLLSSRDDPHPDFGIVEKPVLTITDWATFGEDAAPPGSPLSQPALPAHQQMLLPAAAQKKVDEGAPNRGKDAFDADPMDDEIPF